MNKITIRDIATQAIIASIYVILVLLLPWISFSASIQARIAEVLLVLVFFSKKNAIGIIIGTFIANLSSPYGIIDAISGTTATLIVCIILMYTKKIWIITLLIFPPIINGIIVAGMDAYFTSTMENFFIFSLYVALGELIVVALLGIPFKLMIERIPTIKEYLK
ncbi:QueT transporter family protein [Acholeplasma equifetale]|uniref:QueT transporter family protein n=1 Tax=Acholeplasma equifetale TaxID=264634 RepID=UPI00047DFBF4|nr:QueT transporter family protein [Acholeplasma equifetale]